VYFGVLLHNLINGELKIMLKNRLLSDILFYCAQIFLKAESTVRMEANMGTNLEMMEAKTDANLREIKAEIRANSDEFGCLQSILVSRMDIHQARAEAIQEEITAQMDTHQERMPASVGNGVFLRGPCHVLEENWVDQVRSVSSVRESVKRGLESGGRGIAIVGAVTKKHVVTD
jgi:hypothetical protein